MNWEKEAINDLKTYAARKGSVQNLKERIAELSARAEGLRAISADAPVQGGASRQEYALINNIAERDRLRANLDVVQQLVSLIDKGLAVLDEDERYVLDMFYISRPSMYLDKISDRLHFEKSQIYKIKDRALYKFTVAMYGVIDL